MLTCIDLLAGCGGLLLGLELAGFESLLFSEIKNDAFWSIPESMGADGLDLTEGSNLGKECSLSQD
jgi:hypothetical protein